MSVTQATNSESSASSSAINPKQQVMHIGGVHYLVNARYGGFLASQNDFFIGNSLIKYGEYAEHELQLLKQLIPQGGTVLEVGANIGSLTVPLAKHVGIHGRVIAIEPQRIVHQQLCANVALNALPNVETHHMGCGARTSMMIVPPIDYYAPIKNNFGGIPLQENGDGEPVSIRAIDDLIGERKIHFLKVDVEGMEIEVLRGAKKAIRKHRPVMHVENDRQDKSEALITLIKHYAYRPYWHLSSLFNPSNFFEQTENIYGTIGSVNLLCMPEESTIDMRHFSEATDPKFHPFRR